LPRREAPAYKSINLLSKPETADLTDPYKVGPLKKEYPVDHNMEDFSLNLDEK